MFNSVYPSGVTPYTPQINKRTYKVTADEQSFKPNHEEESSNQQSNSNGQKLNAGIQKVNIKQILIDFENTLQAIGAREDVEEEVKGYLGLVEKQAEKEVPSKKIIVGNLRNASEILDGYISNTLGKSSTVVKDWVDALLLQPIDYKIDKTVTAGFIETVHPEISTKRLIKEESQNKNQPQIQENVENTEDSTRQQTHTDDPLKKAIEEAKQLANDGNTRKALGIYSKIFTYAKKTENSEGQASVLLNVACIQDQQNEVESALKCFNNAAKLVFKTANTEIMEQSHAGMGKIYDEFGNYNSAMEHYFSSLSFAGENENLKSQAEILNNIGNMQKSRFENADALEYYKLAFGLAKQVPDIAGMGTILSNTAGVYKDTGDSVKAIKYYKDSIILDSKVGKTVDIAKSYEQAGDIMLSMGKTLKAADLYKKSMKKAQKCENSQELINRISSKLDNIEFRELTV